MEFYAIFFGAIQILWLMGGDQMNEVSVILSVKIS